MTQSNFRYTITRRYGEDHATGEPILQIAVKVKGRLSLRWKPVKVYRVYHPAEDPDRAAYAELCAAELLEKLQSDETV